MNDTAIYASVKALLEKSVDFKVRNKRSSPLMWAIYIVLFMWIWNRRFMSDFITTIPGLNRIYFPDGLIEQEPENAWPVLAHEGRHLFDAHGNSAWFCASYLFPQGIALIAFLAIPFSLWWLLALVALGPWPAPWRARWERRAYQVSMVMDCLRGWAIEEDWYRNARADEYGWGYYRMVWRRSVAERWVNEDIARARALVAGTLRDDYTAAVLATVRAAAGEGI